MSVQTHRDSLILRGCHSSSETKRYTFCLNLDPAVSLPVVLKDVHASQPFLDGLDSSARSPTGKFYKDNHAVALADTFTSQGNSARIALSDGSIDDQTQHFKRFISRLQAGEMVRHADTHRPLRVLIHLVIVRTNEPCRDTRHVCIGQLCSHAEIGLSRSACRPGRYCNRLKRHCRGYQCVCGRGRACRHCSVVNERRGFLGYPMYRQRLALSPCSSCCSITRPMVRYIRNALIATLPLYHLVFLSSNIDD